MTNTMTLTINGKTISICYNDEEKQFEIEIELEESVEKSIIPAFANWQTSSEVACENFEMIIGAIQEKIKFDVKEEKRLMKELMLHFTNIKNIRKNFEEAKRKLEKIEVFKVDGKINPSKIADKILEDYKIIKTTTDNEEMLYYDSGIYMSNAERIITKETKHLIGDKATQHIINEVILHIKALTYINRNEINKHRNLIHLQNGIFNIDTMQLQPFSPGIISAIRIPVFYDESADCPKIKQFLSEIVKEKDIPVIQELFGYILHRSYFIQKAIMLIGGGSNGKSTFLAILKIFEKILKRQKEN